MKKLHSYIFLVFTCVMFLLTSCKQKQATADHIVINDSTRIVSLNGTVTEILCALGLEQKIVGVDVTSTYPASMHQLPKVGHNRDISAEAILALRPTLVIGITEKIKPELVSQIRSTNAQLLSFSLETTVSGAKKLVTQLSDTLGYADKGVAICKQIDEDASAVTKSAQQPSVLFIYARGAGTVMAAGNNTAAASMIELAGGKNAATGFEDFKPVTAESIVAANPDVVLMFDSGLQSLGGIDGLMQIPGMAQTNAGKNKKVIEMDGQFLTGFGPRTGKAIVALSKMLHEISIP